MLSATKGFQNAVSLIVLEKSCGERYAETLMVG
jgi:hypothetical protein